MRIKYFLMSVLSVIVATQGLSAQDKAQAYLSTDLTSAYLWRGQKNAGVSIQPVVGVKWKGLNAYFWGNEQLSPNSDPTTAKHEIDLFVKYRVLPYLTVGLKDVYVNTRGNGIFSFGSIHHAANGLDVLVDFNTRWLSGEWTTTVAGYDGADHSGKRAYGSYLMLNSAPVNWSYVDWSASVGVVPYYCSRYSDDDSSGFHVNQVAVKGSHKFQLDKKGLVALTVYSQVMLNPSSRKAFFQAGVSFGLNK